MEFPYQKEKSALFGEIYRPIVEFEIKALSGRIDVMGYLDSGADITLLPLSFAKALGIKIEEEKLIQIRGIGQSTVSVVVKEVDLKIAGKILKVSVGIALIEEVPYLLGRKDIFDKFRIIFEEADKRVLFQNI